MNIIVNLKQNKNMINKLINDIFDLKFESNTFAEKKHENAVKQIFIKNGFSEINKNNKIFNILADIKNSTKFIKELKDNFLFIEQPFGSQMCPDFIICIDGFILWIECKSGKDIITWNTGYPKTNILYIFSCKKRNTTTLFFGQSTEIIVKNPTFESDYELYDKELKKLSKKLFEDKFDTDEYSFYMRRMLNDKTKYSNPEIRASFMKEVENILNEKLKG